MGRIKEPPLPIPETHQAEQQQSLVRPPGRSLHFGCLFFHLLTRAEGGHSDPPDFHVPWEQDTPILHFFKPRIQLREFGAFVVKVLLRRFGGHH